MLRQVIRLSIMSTNVTKSRESLEKVLVGQWLVIATKGGSKSLVPVLQRLVDDLIS